MKKLFSCHLFFAALTGCLFMACESRQVDYNADVKPILNKRCISCHGGVKQNGGFSLLFRNEALDTTESGKYAIVPGDPGQSEMIRRIRLTDPEERMPYKEEPLSPDEIRILTRWVEEGAVWGDHWAYVPPAPVSVPQPAQLLSGLGEPAESWAKNNIDYFVLGKLNDLRLRPSPEADKATLIRRVSMDITGLPPSPEQAETFFRDTAENAYEKVVDELLASPRYGEKWASWWLDLARYADTKGYESDAGRNIWRFRDYVIKSLNEDKPFDQFTIEQLAGDMLPDAADEQIIATAFHRNTMNNDEGGTDDEEFRIAAVIDRVNTTWEVWQSTTMACVQCHSHPYDPIRHDEYYRSFALFNNTRDEDVAGEHPLLRSYAEEDQQHLDRILRWVKQAEGDQKAREVSLFLRTLEPKFHCHVMDRFEDGELNGYKWLSVRHGGHARLKQVDLTGKTQLFFNYVMQTPGGSFEIRKGHPEGEMLARVRLEKAENARIVDIALKPTDGIHDLYFVFSNPSLPPLRSVCLIEWFSFQEALPGKNMPGYREIESAQLALLNSKPVNTPVLVEAVKDQQRTTQVFERGNWLVKGDAVEPGIPEVFSATGQPATSDRLGFARWLTSPGNPLTARTIVNRIWEQVFGMGLVETLEDFGSQGELPSHPELLDFLALRMSNEHQWRIKKLLKEIVMSSTYRQRSAVTPEAEEKDLHNRWLARGARVRLSAEQVRDQALAVSGLLSDKMYGKSVMPLQPDGIWNSVYNSEYWKLSEGEDRYRRAVYTYIKRTSPYPSMMMFDGSSREVCISRRIRTNTPLQALVTLNDPVFVEASGTLARRMISHAGGPSREAIRHGYYLLTLKEIPDNKLSVLDQLFQEASSSYRADTAAVRAVTRDKAGTPEVAAMTTVANALLNLDEVIMKE